MPVSEYVLTEQQKIAELARKAPDLSFLSLNHYLSKEWLDEAYRRTRKGGAAGIDEQTAEEYAQDLQNNLSDLLERAKSGNYRAPPVRRVYIPKEGKGGERRPLGIPTIEDKVLQRAVCMMLEPIYEQDFLSCSYGFRPKRSAHECIKGIQKTLYEWQGGYVIDADIKGYFDTIDKTQLRAFLDERVRDGVVRRLIGKWLKAGVMEAGQISYSETGTPQGGVISPLLSNIYLHKVLDTWFRDDVQPRLESEAKLFRYADDFIIICKSKRDAERIMDVLPKRFGRFGLTIHPDKTKLVDFHLSGVDGERAAVFNFLGFTFYSGTTKRGRYTAKLKTRRERLRRGVRKAHELCRAIRHEPLREQQKKLNRFLQGSYRYYGVSYNGRSIQTLHHRVIERWQFWLNRRSQRRDMPWVRFNEIMRFFPLETPRLMVTLF